MNARRVLTRCAVVQLAYQPAAVLSSRSPLEEPIFDESQPCLFPSSRDPKLRRKLKAFRIRIRSVYSQWMLRRIEIILSTLRQWQVQVVVTKVRIAVLHHPVSPLPQTEVAAFAGTLNAGQVKATLIDSKFCLVLHGHLHAGWFGAESWPAKQEGWVLHIASAPTLGSDATGENNGYNEIEIAFEGTERCYVTVRRIRHAGNRWSLDKEMGPFEPGKSEQSTANL